MQNICSLCFSSLWTSIGLTVCFLCVTFRTDLCLAAAKSAQICIALEEGTGKYIRLL